MTEKVTPVTAFQKGLTKKGNPYYTVNLADGRQATCFDKLILEKLNQEIEVDVKQSEYNGQMEYVINFPGSGGGRPGFNLEFNQKKVALECSVKSGALESDDEILKRAGLFLNWLKQ